jgi:hypothetical protein
MITVRPQTEGRFSMRALSADLTDFAVGCRQLLESVMKEEASLTARAAIKFSAPMSAPKDNRAPDGQFQVGGGAGGDGDQKSSETWGNAATETSIRSVIKTVDESLLAATSDFSNVNDYIKWRQANGPEKAQTLWLAEIIRSEDYQSQYVRLKYAFQNRQSLHKPLDAGGLRSWHHKMRRSFGYIGLGRKKGARAFMAHKENQRFADEGTIQAYVLDAVKKVGFLKSGWVKCIQEIGPVKIMSKKYPMGREKVFGMKQMPRYIMRHAGPGKVQSNVPSAYDRSATSAEYRISILNMVGNAGGSAKKARVTEHVLMERYKIRKAKVAKYASLFDRAAAKFNAGN